MVERAPQAHLLVARSVARIAAGLAILLIRCYQAGLRPFLIGSCKFHPTCSEYAVQAIMQHGPWRGAWLGFRRLCRCHPIGPGGIDPVPQARPSAAAQVASNQ
ncbi:MAG: membrane protein insertion efficiency factor YidD [Planctomycetes bacterium]|nr:membrane protein insertion efficiency factor YidD [Planctomycetota bacterium]